MAEIDAHQKSDDAGLTTREWADKFGRSTEWTRLKIGKLWREGKLTRGTRRIEDIQGRNVPVTVYRLKK